MVDVKNYIKKEVIRRCPYCHQDMKMHKGLTSENIKRLFRKPTMEDFITLFILFMAITSFLIYNYEIKTYKAYINDNCPIGQHNQQSIYIPEDLTSINLSTNTSFELNNTESDNGEKG